MTSRNDSESSVTAPVDANPCVREGGGTWPLEARRGDELDRPDERDREIAGLRECLSRLNDASLRINESLDFDTVLQGVFDSARSLTEARLRGDDAPRR